MASTKLIVLKSKEIIYTVIFLILIILMIIILTIMFSSNKKGEKGSKNTEKSQEYSSFEPGTYSSTVALGEETIGVMVTVDNESITNVEFENLSESVTTLYPLLESSMEDINTQLQYVSSIDDITYSSETKYTTTILCKAIKNALKNATK